MHLVPILVPRGLDTPDLKFTEFIEGKVSGVEREDRLNPKNIPIQEKIFASVLAT